MSDFYVNWNGDLAFGDSGDFRTATDDDYARQRIIRRLLSNPVVKDVTGAVIVPPDDLFEPDYGAGLTRDVDTPSTAGVRAERESRIRTALASEEVVDRSKPVDVQFGTDRNRGIEYIAVTVTTLRGTQLQIGLQV